MRLLLVEDDKLLGKGIHTGLRQAGYAVDWVMDGDAADAAVALEPYDLMILDLGLPRRSGLDVLDHVRESGKDLPVLILTARDSVNDKIIGLDRGADDYMIKPFDLDYWERAFVRCCAGKAGAVRRCSPMGISNLIPPDTR